MYYDVSEADAVSMYSLVYSLPKFHQYGDVLSVWPTGLSANGPLEHDCIVPRRLRDACRNRCTLAKLQKSNDQRYTAVFVSVPDWTPGPYFETLPFVEAMKAGVHCPPGYLEWNRKWVSIDQLFVFWVQQIRMALASIRSTTSQKATIRLWPLVSKRVCPESHQSFLGYLYGFACLTALQSDLDSSWVEAVEICDFLDVSAEVFFGHMTQYMIHFVPIKRPSFSYHEAVYEVMPSDNFCWPGFHSHTLENSLTSDTNLADVLTKPWTFHGLQGYNHTIRGLPDRWNPGSVSPRTHGWLPVATSMQSYV